MICRAAARAMSSTSAAIGGSYGRTTSSRMTNMPITPITSPSSLAGSTGRPAKASNCRSRCRQAPAATPWAAATDAPALPVVERMNNGTVKYDPTTGQFNGWSIGSPMCGLDPEGNVWTIRRQGELNKIDTTNASSMPTMYPIPKNGGIYDLDTDSKG